MEKGYKRLKVYNEAHKLELSRDLGYISEQAYKRLEAQRKLAGSLLGGLIKYLKRA